MARTKRRSSKGRSARVKYDWVVNDRTYGRTSVTTVPNGTVAAFPLTYPKMQQSQPLWSGSNVGGSAFPTDGDRQYVKAVSGTVTWTPNAWIAGVRMDHLMRIVKKPMDFTTEDAIADALYDLYDADYANERFSWQHHAFEPFNSGSNFPDLVRVKATVNQWLEPDEALFIIVESDMVGIASLTYRFYLRTLMRVD